MRVNSGKNSGYNEIGGMLMEDFKAVRAGEVSVMDLVAGYDVDDLRAITNEMIDYVLALIEDCTDEDVVFEPLDEGAHDPWAATPEEVDIAWNLGHVIVHITASAEESAALAAEMARGVANHGRSRYETPWERVTTIEMCRHRLEESRRMRLASLDMWPDEPHLDVVYMAWKGGPQINAVGRYILGVMHEDDHLGQIREIVRQARSARAAQLGSG
jgi:hypothetical protein